MSQHTTAPSLDDIAALAEQALHSLPEEILQVIDGVVLRIDDFPDDATLDEMGIESPFELLGLYRGVDIGHKDGGYQPHDVDMVFLYRRPLLDYWCESGEDLAHVVRHVLIHEIGHHLGLSDADMDAIEQAVA